MDQCLDLLTSLNRFDVLKTNDDEGEGGQYYRETERQDEPETSVAFSSFGLHGRPENTPGSAGLCQAYVKIC